MVTLKELQTTKRVWKPNWQDVAWAQNGQLDCGQKVNQTTYSDDKTIELTMDDLHYMPTQEMLKTYKFVAKPDVFKKLFKAYFTIRTVKKDKVVKTEVNLEEIA